MDKIKEMKQQMAEWTEEHKKIVMSIAIGLVLFMLLMFNIGFIQISYYRMTQETEKIVNVLSKDIKDEKKHQKSYFISGLDYLMQDMSETSMRFFEKYFKLLNQEMKVSVLDAYNQENQLFESQGEILEDITKGNRSESIKSYINRLDITSFELVLVDYFGQELQLTQDVAMKLYNITSLYDKKLPMNKFNVSIYELMTFPQMTTEDSIAVKLLDVIEPSAIHRILFTELKTEPIDVDTLNSWVDILNKKKVISTQEYASFTNSYNSIKQLRDEYTQLQYQEVDIKNVTQKIDVETTEYISKIDKLIKEGETVEKDISNKKVQVSNMKKYKTIELYIMDYYEDGTYEASVPEKSWFFGTYKPSDEKLKLELTTSKLDTQGVFAFDVYYKGESEEGLPYYVEVSKEEKQQITQLETEIINLRAVLEQKQSEYLKLQGEVDKIRKANNYEQNNRLLQEVTHKKENVLLKLKERQVEIQNLFGIGNVIIEIDKK